MTEMTIDEVNTLICNCPLDPNIVPDTPPWASQYDRRSAAINYAMVRHFTPTTVVEFGTRGGRCTHDILKALIANDKDFVFKPYEIDKSMRLLAEKNLTRFFGNKAPEVGGDIMEANDLPDDIDYLFVDNSHDYETTDWVFKYLLPKKCRDGALVHFHDLVIWGDHKFTMPNIPDGIPDGGELKYFYELVHSHKLPLEKIYWTWEEGLGGSSTWWRFKKK